MCASLCFMQRGKWRCLPSSAYVVTPQLDDALVWIVSTEQFNVQAVHDSYPEKNGSSSHKNKDWYLARHCFVYLTKLSVRLVRRYK